ncbi:unnamed protein product [Prunus brigantina]
MVTGDVDSGASEVISVALFLSFACALISTMSLLANCAGVPARSTVRQGFDRVWVGNV